MTDHDMAERLRLIHAAKTPIEGIVNLILEVLDNAVVVQSDRTESRRTVSFAEIRRGSTSHGSIVQSFRTILGLE